MEKGKSKYCKCLYYSANALSRIMTKMADEEFAVTGLTSSYAFLLMLVNEKPGIQPKEISYQMQLTASTVTRLIEKIENRGFVKRKYVGRIAKVYPAMPGLDLQPKMKAAWSGLYKRYSDALGKNNGERLTAEIYRSAQQLE